MLKPNDGESLGTFISRFVSDESIKKEKPTVEARYRAGVTKWNEHFAEIEKRFSVYKPEVAKEMAKVIAPSEEEVVRVLKDMGAYDTEVVIAKAMQDQQLVFGWASISVNADGSIPLDWSGDIIEPEQLEFAAYVHVLNFRATGQDHQGDIQGVLVESVIFTEEKMAAMGIPKGFLPIGWWVGYFIEDPEVFARIKSGEYKMFSVQGKAVRQKIEEGGNL